MSDLIVIGYPDEDTAEKVWQELVALQYDYLVDLSDAAIIRRDRMASPRHHACPPHRNVGRVQRSVLGGGHRPHLLLPNRAGRSPRGRPYGCCHR